MEEQNPNSITPLVSGSLSKANACISITNKILSESKHEFYGDFEGKKIWAINTGIKRDVENLLEYTTLVIYEDTLLIYSQSHGFKLFNKDTGELKCSLSDDKMRFSSIFLSKNFGKIGCFLFAIQHSNNHFGLYKLLLPFLRPIKAVVIMEGAEDDYKVKVQTTHDNKYVVTTCIGKSENRMSIIFWDIITLNKVDEMDIVNGEAIYFTENSNLFLVLSKSRGQDFVNGGYDKDDIPMKIEYRCLSLFDTSSKKGFVKELINADIYYEKIDEIPGVSFDYNPKLNIVFYHLSYCHYVELYNLHTGKHLKNITILNNDSCLKFSNTGNYFMEDSGKCVFIYDTKEFKLLAGYNGFYRENENEELDNCSYMSIFDSDDKYIYTLSFDGTIHKWK